MNIIVYSNFKKRSNSTRRPSGGTTIENVRLKDQCSIKNPVFEINTLDFSINYVQAFGNYYYCDVTNLDSHRSELICKIDVMATFRDQIGGYTGMIDYCSKSTDVTITDPRNTPTGLIDFTVTNAPFTTSNFSDTGCYILTVLNNKANGACGCTTYYALLPAQLEDLSRELYDASWWTQTVDQFLGVHDSLVSCIWIPVDITKISGSSEAIAIGSDTMTSASGKKISSRLLYGSTGITAINYSANSGAGYAGMTYLERAPYCTGEVYLPFVGLVPLAVDVAAYTKQIDIHYIVDVITGDIVYQVRYSTYQVETFSGSIATKMPISSATYDGVGVAGGLLTSIGGAIGTVASAVTGNIPGILASAGAAIGGATSAVTKSIELHTQINGTNSSAIGVKLGKNPYIIMMQNTPVEKNLTSYKSAHGMPFFQVATVASCGGYVQCHDASVSIPGDGSEQETVNNIMNSGFYYE